MGWKSTKEISRTELEKKIEHEKLRDLIIDLDGPSKI